MVMTTRVLPPHEWPRLVGTELETVCESLPHEHAKVLVVEADGEIVACWALLSVLHVEGVWIRPGHRARGAVGRRLLQGMAELVAESGGAGVVSAACTPDVARLLTGLGAVKLDVDHYGLSLKRWIPTQEPVCLS
jgi:N-acetylglutamate synthase-like GNAT family acetyltransferase